MKSLFNNAYRQFLLGQVDKGEAISIKTSDISTGGPAVLSAWSACAVHTFLSLLLTAKSPLPPTSHIPHIPGYRQFPNGLYGLMAWLL